MATPVTLAVPGIPIIIVAALYYISKCILSYVARKKIAIPKIAQGVLEKLGGNVVVEAYYEAEKAAAESDAKRDIAAKYIKCAAGRIGLIISEATINFLIEFVVNIIHHEGPESEEALIKAYPGEDKN